MSSRAKKFVSIPVALGVLYLAFMGLHWQSPEPRKFLIYLSIAVLCSVFQLKRVGFGTAFSVSMPFVLISIVQLSLAEAVTVGCAAALAQCLWVRAKFTETVLAVGMPILAVRSSLAHVGPSMSTMKALMRPWRPLG